MRQIVLCHESVRFFFQMPWINKTNFLIPWFTNSLMPWINETNVTKPWIWNHFSYAISQWGKSYAMNLVKFVFKKPWINETNLHHELVWQSFLCNEDKICWKSEDMPCSLLLGRHAVTLFIFVKLWQYDMNSKRHLFCFLFLCFLNVFFSPYLPNLRR